MLQITLLISTIVLLINFIGFVFITNIVISLKDRANELYKKICNNQNDTTLMQIDFNNLESEIKKMKEVGRIFLHNIIVCCIFFSLTSAFLFSDYFCNETQTKLTKLFTIIYIGFSFAVCSIFIYDCIYQINYIFKKKSTTLK